MTRAPRVSIGLPVYNGAESLPRALDSLLAQTCADFELIVSDNASTDATGDICARYAQRDPRLRHVRQPRNIGAMPNFEFVLRSAQGEFFMWAADDDRWAPDFLQSSIDVFADAGPDLVAVGSEAQYTVGGVLQPFFAEGKAFRAQAMDDAAGRVAYMLANNFGNLIYSVYRREALVRGDRTLLGLLTRPTLNEIPFFVQVAARGNWRILPQVRFYKETNDATYRQAMWEMVGGPLPPIGPYAYLKACVNGARYHLNALPAILESIALTELPARDRRRLKRLAVATLAAHFGQLTLRHKRATA